MGSEDDSRPHRPIFVVMGCLPPTSLFSASSAQSLMTNRYVYGDHCIDVFCVAEVPRCSAEAGQMKMDPDIVRCLGLGVACLQAILPFGIRGE